VNAPDFHSYAAEHGSDFRVLEADSKSYGCYLSDLEHSRYL
jgi:hypothetical protein